MNSESGRSVELFMMLVSLVAARPSDAMPTPDEVQMNCESDSMMFVMSDILLGRGNRAIWQLVEVDDGSTAFDYLTASQSECVDLFISDCKDSCIFKRIAQRLGSVVEVIASAVRCVQHDGHPDPR